MSLRDAYNKLLPSQVGYFKQYTYDRPLLLTQKTSADMKFIQQALFGCIRYFTEHLSEYSTLMPLSDSAQRVIDICKDIEYEPGTYRTDFVITGDNQLKLIEITSRYALNGYLRSGFVNACVLPYMEKFKIELEDRYSSFFTDLENYLGSKETIVLLKNDHFNEGKYVREMMKYAGRNVVTLTMDEIPVKSDTIAQSACISQLSHDEIFSLPDDVIRAIADSNVINDLRTVILVHDKRFFAVINNDAFREKALGKTDSDRFKEFLTPTYTKYSHPELWEQLREEKNDWIIKPPAFGMSIGITAGIAVSENEWLRALKSFDGKDVIFQPYLNQTRFSGSVGSEIRKDDYVVGTLLFFQDEYYGPGLFRASGHPVTNQGDDRKIAVGILSAEPDQELYTRERGWLF